MRGKPARLALADGRIFRGESFGAHADGGMEVTAEVVFNTSHTGYQEIITDPSYQFEAVTFTVPILGIYGVTSELDHQSAKPHASAILCREVSHRSSSWRAKSTLPEWMREVGLPGIAGLDTRTLTKRLRDEGSAIGVLSNGDDSDDELVDKAKAAKPMEGRDLAKEVTTTELYTWNEGFSPENTPWSSVEPEKGEGTVVVVDFGVKRDILRHIAARGFELTVVPATTPLEAILERQPNGVMLSNGPGDPAAVGYGIELVRGLVGASEKHGLPVYGVCLGYQILSLALGAQTHHMKFGHRGGNHPIRDLETGRVLISAHNHGFAVDPKTLDGTPLVPTYESLFDGTLEGVKHRELPVAAVQFHPEAGPGPHEAETFFDHFVRAMRGELVQKS